MAKKQTMTLDQALQVILATDGENPLRQMLEWMVQQALEHEMGEHLGADRYQRSDERLGYRNGHKTRVFTTAVGDLNLLVPRTETGPFPRASSSATSAADKALALSLMEMYVQGVSTRKVASITETLCGRSFSSQQYRSWRPSWTRSSRSGERESSRPTPTRTSSWTPCTRR